MPSGQNGFAGCRGAPGPSQVWCPGHVRGRRAAGVRHRHRVGSGAGRHAPSTSASRWRQISYRITPSSSLTCTNHENMRNYKEEGAKLCGIAQCRGWLYSQTLTVEDIKCRGAGIATILGDRCPHSHRIRHPKDISVISLNAYAIHRSLHILGVQAHAKMGPLHTTMRVACEPFNCVFAPPDLLCFVTLRRLPSTFKWKRQQTGAHHCFTCSVRTFLGRKTKGKLGASVFLGPKNRPNK